MYHVNTYVWLRSPDRTNERLQQNETKDFKKEYHAISEWLNNSVIGDRECGITADTQEEAEELLRFYMNKMKEYRATHECRYDFKYLLTAASRKFYQYKNGLREYTPNTEIDPFCIG